MDTGAVEALYPERGKNLEAIRDDELRADSVPMVSASGWTTRNPPFWIWTLAHGPLKPDRYQPVKSLTQPLKMEYRERQPATIASTPAFPIKKIEARKPRLNLARACEFGPPVAFSPCFPASSPFRRPYPHPLVMPMSP
jgi:hypothetical protein